MRVFGLLFVTVLFVALACSGSDTPGPAGPEGPAGEAGAAALLRVEEVAAGDRCPAGGSAIHAGVDDDGDGVLDDDEVAQTAYACDGADGADGTEGSAGDDGDAGRDGASALIRLDDEAPGAACDAGGTAVHAGVDDDGDGVLDDAEIDETAYVCHGARAVADAGVDDSGTIDGGPDPYSGPRQIASIESPACVTGSPDIWTFDVTLDGLADLVTLDIVESSSVTPWDESHDLANYDYDVTSSAWDKWMVNLEQVTTPGEVVSGQTTLFGCEWNDGYSLAFRVEMYGGGTRLDCAIFGYQAQQTFADSACVCFDLDGDCTN